MSISAISSYADAYSGSAPATSTQSSATAFAVDGTPPHGSTTAAQRTDPIQQAGAVQPGHRHHHGGSAGAGLGSVSGTAPQAFAAGGLGSALNVLV